MSKYELNTNWHRLNTCQAQYAHLKRKGFEYWYLISYNSMICRVSHITHNGKNSWRLDVTKYWDYSNTTYQHLYKFFKLIPDCPFNPYWMQEYKSLKLHNGIQDFHFAQAYHPMYKACICTSDTDTVWGYYRNNSCQRNSYPCEVL